MKKILKWLLIGAVGLMLLGGSLYFVGFAMSGFKVEALSSTKYESKHFNENAENLLTSIKIDYDATDVVVVFDDAASSVTVEYPQKQTKKGKNINMVTVTETAGNLIISEREKFYLWDWIGGFTPTLTVTLPAARSYDLVLDVDYGDVVVRGSGSVNSLTLELGHGDVNTQRAEIVCASTLRMEIDHGDIEMGNVQAEKMYISSEYGDLECEKSVLHVKEIYMDMEHGDVDVDFLQADKIIFEMEHGDIEMTLYGDRTDYTVQIEIEYGETNIRDVIGGEKFLQIFSEHGDVEIDFKK